MGKRWSWETISRGALSDRRTGRGRGYESHGRGRGREQTGRDRGRDRGHGGRGGQATVGDRDGPAATSAVGSRGHGRGNAIPSLMQDAKADAGGVSGAALRDARVQNPLGDGNARVAQVATGKGDGDDQGKKRKRNQASKRECAICCEEHFTNQCPLLRGPKPAVAFCGAAEDGTGFFQIQTARNNQIVDNFQSTTAALISVEASEVSAQLLQAELARIIPVRWEWEVQQQGDSFVVPFPSMHELERMVAIRTITTKNKEGTIVFENFVEDVQPIKVLEQVWITVTRVPRILRAFLPLWAVGSVVGATQKVDMVHLRATGQVRILVAVIDTMKIPKYADVCAGCDIYRLYFKPDEAPQEDESDPEEDDDLLGDEDKQADGDRVMKDAEDQNPSNPQANNSPKKSSEPPQKFPLISRQPW